MKKILLASLFALPALIACPADPPPDGDADGVVDAEDKCPTEAGDKANNGCKPAPPAPVIPEYAPMGDDAELKKQGAMGIDDKNAAAKAAEIEKTLDEAIAKLKTPAAPAATAAATK